MPQIVDDSVIERAIELLSGVTVTHSQHVKIVSAYTILPVRRGRPVGRLPKSKCKRGHLRTPENIDKIGACIECRRQYGIDRWAKRNAAGTTRRNRAERKVPRRRECDECYHARHAEECWHEDPKGEYDCECVRRFRPRAEEGARAHAAE